MTTAHGVEFIAWFAGDIGLWVGYVLLITRKDRKK